jgi:predicted MPP superfamily phosphohydrolase
VTKARLWTWVAAALLAGTEVLLAVGYRNATAAPVVRRLHFKVPDYPAGAAPVSILLFSDVHVHGPDMPPERLARIVDQINALHPDIVVGTGDFVGDNWIGRTFSAEDALSPLGRLRARLGVYAVLGNNDYESYARGIRPALRKAGVHLLEDQATSVGPIALGGLDGFIYHLRKPWEQARLKTAGAMSRTPGVKILAAHRSDEVVPAAPFVRLVLAGHTHCGQIVLPLIGALASGSDYGSKFLCGIIRDRSKALVVTAGLGTSHLPLRFGAPPDMWLITVSG